MAHWSEAEIYNSIYIYENYSTAVSALVQEGEYKMYIIESSSSLFWLV